MEKTLELINREVEKGIKRALLNTPKRNDLLLRLYAEVNHLQVHDNGLVLVDEYSEVNVDDNQLDFEISLAYIRDLGEAAAELLRDIYSSQPKEKKEEVLSAEDDDEYL